MIKSRVSSPVKLCGKEFDLTTEHREITEWLKSGRKKMNKRVEFTLNGNPVSAEIDENTTLLDLLREEFSLISPKNGCSPQGQCGCCTVIVANRATVSCVVNADRVAGKTVLTLEGLSEHERDIFSRSFVLRGGLQCGFCIPGIVP